MAAPSRESYSSLMSEDGSPESILSFSNSESPRSLKIIDHVERRSCQIRTDAPISITEASSDQFYMPVDRGVTVSLDKLSIPHKAAVFVRNSWGVMVDELTNGDSREFPRDTYSIELTAPVKLYLNVDSAFSISVDQDGVSLEFPDKEIIAIGARSHHDHPAGTITVTPDPVDIMRGVSLLGSSLKTHTCERSYPTLRGHPPIIDIGDEFHVPEVVEEPKTGVSIEVPPNLSSIYPIAPLAFYLGATVKASESPRIRTEAGFSYPLSSPDRSFEDEVERILKQIFFLDCVTRTEGFYQVQLHERNQVEPYVDIDLGQLYDLPIAEQLEEYLSIPYETIEHEVPNWKLTAHVNPETKYLEYLPFLIHDLAIIRTAKGEDIGPADIGARAIEDFMRSNSFVRSSTTTRSTSAGSLPKSLIDPVEVDSLEHAWVGPDVPIGASKALIDAYHNRLGKQSTSGEIEITVVCNDEEMGEERDIVNRVYGSREELSFDVDVHRQVSRTEFSEILRTETDFLHYIGHIDEDGFKCVDGRFDASTLNESNVDSFFLNACTSYRQGRYLIEAGSIAGVVTLNEVVNSGAEIVGKSLAKLLNQGFPLRAALSIAKTQSIMGNQYIVLGDGNADIAQPASGTALLLTMDDDTSGSDLNLSIETFPTGDRSIGSMFVPYIEGYERFHLCSGTIGPFNLSNDMASEYLEMENFPILRNRTLYWSENSGLDDLFD